MLRSASPTQLVDFLCRQREADHEDALYWHAAAIHCPDIHPKTWQVLHAYLPITYLNYIGPTWRAFNSERNTGYDTRGKICVAANTLWAWFETVPLVRLGPGTQAGLISMVTQTGLPRDGDVRLDVGLAEEALRCLDTLPAAEFFRHVITLGRYNEELSVLEPLAVLLTHRLIAEHSPNKEQRERGQTLLDTWIHRS